jgi:hypothetical protein
MLERSWPAAIKRSVVSSTNEHFPNLRLQVISVAQDWGQEFRVLPSRRQIPDEFVAGNLHPFYELKDFLVRQLSLSQE